MSLGTPIPPPEDGEIRVATSAKLGAKLKINSAPSEIIDATAAQILLAQPNHEMDFYELATAVFNAFEVEGVRRLAVTRHMLRFRRELEAARSSRDAWLRKRLEVGQRLVPSLVDASFMQFVLRMLSFFEDGLTEREIAQCWLDQHTSWFGEAYRDTVAALGSRMLDPVLRSLLARQDEWDIQLVQRIDPRAPSMPAPPMPAAVPTADGVGDAYTAFSVPELPTGPRGRTGGAIDTSGTAFTGSPHTQPGPQPVPQPGPQPVVPSDVPRGSTTSTDSAASAASASSTQSAQSAQSVASAATSIASSDGLPKAPELPADDVRSAIRWKSVAPFDTRQKAIIVPSIIFENYPALEDHPVKGSLSYYLPPYNAFFLATPNAAEASLAARFLNSHDPVR